MAKTKKEMRKAMANYAEIILRKNKYIQELKDRICGLDQTMQMDRAYIAALLLEREGQEYNFRLEEIRELMTGSMVVGKQNEDGSITLKAIRMENIEQKEEV